MSNITAENVRNIFALDMETGVLYWRDIDVRARCGDCVGFISYSSGNPYLKLSYKGKKYYVHRVIWLYIHGEWAKEIDHKDRNTLNNAPTNLRSVTRGQNAGNFVRSAHGVHKHGRKFRAVIIFEGVKYRLGSYDTKEEAETVYKENHLKFYGEHSIYRKVI